jgi:putative phosphoesterase
VKLASAHHTIADSMRIAVVSDIHANWTALQAVIDDLAVRAPDVVINGGDLVGSGARPAEVIDLVASLGWRGVFGNTDEALWNPRPLREFAQRLPALQATWDAVSADVEWTRAAVGDARIEKLKRLPIHMSEANVAVVHASMESAWSSPLTTASDDDLRAAYGPLGASVVVYGHVHTPFIREMDGLTVANSGSVGMPHDGDSRASYLLIDNGRPCICRVEYDVEAEIRELTARHHPLVDWIATILRTARYAAPRAT